ncbi:Receptor-interacting serine/threonine-protein kinase 1 [Holothuria leucospilota]|uniref:Receptor-interacting serine/threonine-protein kinase 1 n=1 Tax=Holothuria leucospilota TaxID=206669 RepID=A0A9Q1H2C3_HOLLE|nr:Receptor-interacting serine/threonine-protein kinase 1 [Holothuria leucospilota]
MSTVAYSMLGGNSQDDGRVEDSQSSDSGGAQNGLSNMIKACIRDEMRKCFSSMERKLVHYFETRFADLTEQQGVLQANVEDVEKKQDVLQSRMEEIEGKMDKLLQVEKRVEEKLAANCAILEMMLYQARNQFLNLEPGRGNPCDDDVFGRGQRLGHPETCEHKVPDHQGATDESSRATGWSCYARALTPWSRWIGVQPSQEESCDNTTLHSSQPPLSNTTAVTTVTTVASTVKTVQVHQQNIPSSQLPNAVTTPTSSYLQPRTQPQSVQQSSMSRALPRESRGQVHPDILLDVLAAARRYYHQMSDNNITSECNHITVTVRHLEGDTINCIMALVNDAEQHVAVKSLSLDDQAIHPSSIHDQTSVFPQLPQVPRRRKASCGGTILTEVMILKVSRLIGHKWKSIGIECLHFSSDDLSRIDADYKDVESKIFEMIKRWHRKQGVEGGTVEKLADSFKKSCEIDCNVFDFMDSLKEPTESTE